MNMARMGKDLICIQPLCIFASHNPDYKLRRFCDSPLAVSDSKGYVHVCPYAILLRIMSEAGHELTPVQRMMLDNISGK
jgi:hypothetical protein